MKVSIVMCEGPHDAAFVSRLLLEDGYNTYNSKLNEYPGFVRDFILNNLNTGSLEDLNLKVARGGLFLPSFALNKEENLILLYNLGGDSKKEARKKIVSSFVVLFEEAGNGLSSSLLSEDDRLSIIYLYDADDKGIQSRVDEVREELREFLDLKEEIKIEHAKYSKEKGVLFGLYVFADPTTLKGRLEDLVIPLMKDKNEDIYVDVYEIVSKRCKREYTLFSIPERKKDKDFDDQKAIIGMMGQLQKSGSPNATVIEQSSFISSAGIAADATCQQIISFLNESFL